MDGRSKMDGRLIYAIPFLQDEESRPETMYPVSRPDNARSMNL